YGHQMRLWSWIFDGGDWSQTMFGCFAIPNSADSKLDPTTLEPVNTFLINAGVQLPALDVEKIK
ncbi:hypothetical protein AVEN_140927-2-1, partial [Araneus ventricosus]